MPRKRENLTAQQLPNKKWRELITLPLHTLRCLSLPIPMSNNASRKRAPPPPSQPPPAKQALMTQEEEFMDEDVFINETLVSEDEESLILRDIEQRQALANRLSKWTRPPLSADYVAGTRSVRECFPLIISLFLWF